MPARRARRLHVHLQGNPEAPSPFHMTRERYAAAARRHRSIALSIVATIGTDPERLERELRTADVLVGFWFRRDNLAARAPKLKWIHIIGAGIDHLLPLDWLPPGVALVNNRGVHALKAGEFAAMAILMLNNRMPALVTQQRQHQWNEVFSTGVDGKTLVIVGVGELGGAAAKRARQLGLRVLGVRRNGRPHRDVHEMFTPRDLHRVLPRADFVLVATPLTRETRGMIGRRELDRLKPHAGLINMCRAAVVEYEALADKLQRGELSGAILDVFDPEPLPHDSTLWDAPNLIITPHVSSDDAEEYMPRTLDLLFENVRRYLAGRPFKNRVDAAREY